MGGYEIYLARHGRTRGNRLRIILGRRESDESKLDAHGRAQAMAMVGPLEGKGIAMVLHGPMARTRETARIVALRLGAPMQEEPALTELDTGEATGVQRDVWLTANPSRSTPWYMDYVNFPFAGGESFSMVYRRLAARFGPWLTTPPEAPRLLVTHGLCVQLLLALFLGVERTRFLQEPVPTGSLFRVTLGERPSARRLLPEGEVVLTP